MYTILDIYVTETWLVAVVWTGTHSLQEGRRGGGGRIASTAPR